MMETKDWLIVGATFLSPILAVQAQAELERIRERNKRKRAIFQTLMGTRAAKLSADHIKALNMIDLVFYGRRIFGCHYRTGKEKAVVEAWKLYFDHLNHTMAEDAVWNSKSFDLFDNLLKAIAADTGYSFDPVQLRRNVYYPTGQENA